MHWTPKGYKPWRQWPKVPSEKPKHKNNSMSKNKIPSSEVPGARPLPAAGTSPFPCSWRSQAGLTQSRSAQPSSQPDLGGVVWQQGAPPCGRGQTAALDGKRRPDPQAPQLGRSRSPQSRRLRPCPAWLSAVRVALPLPTGPPLRPAARPKRKCALCPGPPLPRDGSALPPPLPPAPRHAAPRVPDRPLVTWPRAGGGPGPGAGRPGGRAGQSLGGARHRSWMAGAARSAAAAAARTWHAWMSLPWLWHGGPKAPLPHRPCPGALGKGWGFPAGPPEPGDCDGLPPGQQGKRVLGGSAERRAAGHLDLLPPGFPHGGAQWGLPVARHSPRDGDHAALRRPRKSPVSGVGRRSGQELQRVGPQIPHLSLVAGAWRLKQLLSFALGGLLGNVFLHLLPEAWAYTCSAGPGGEGQSLQQQQQLGLWVIAGILTFLALEKMFLDSKAERTSQVSGYLNLLANTIDNFTHGLAVAASFLVSKKIGLLTTMAILLHEIPHEVGDFAILLRAGFDRWSAAKLQLSTALGGLLGAGFAICTQSPKGVEETAAWVLPFTSGGFLYIALVNVLPDLLEEEDPWRSLQQLLLLCAGIVVMVLFSIFVD
nr:zinc transporter ZIP13 isoform X4 [Macaca fascicularis]